tara:strand:- start:90 stop:467 length:378 start_codon:yes stop_codon:yes gene_type:complete
MSYQLNSNKNPNNLFTVSPWKLKWMYQRAMPVKQATNNIQEANPTCYYNWIEGPNDKFQMTPGNFPYRVDRYTNDQVTIVPPQDSCSKSPILVPADPVPTVYIPPLPYGSLKKSYQYQPQFSPAK